MADTGAAGWAPPHRRFVFCAATAPRFFGRRCRARSRQVAVAGAESQSAEVTAAVTHFDNRHDTKEVATITDPRSASGSPHHP